jgi:SAM-dependent methyltransferase
VELGAAHQRIYDPQQFDGVIATGWSCYFPLEYWQIVLDEIKRILKPGGVLLVDILNLESPLAEDWAILETYLGTEVLLTSLEEWKPLIRKMGGTLAQTSEGELFQLLKIRF